MNKKIFTNGHIYTMNREMPFATALVMNDDKIEFVGNDKEAFAYKDSDAEVIDLDGKMMVPGFIDAHCHPMLTAAWLSGLLVSIDWSEERVLEEVRKYVEAHPEKDCYFGMGYAEWNYDEKGPHKKELDAICSDKPIFIYGSGGHEAWCNSKALEVANVTKDTPDPLPPLQYFERDEEGNPTGHIVELGASNMIISAANYFTVEDLTEGLETLSNNGSAMGFTSFIDCGILGDMADIVPDIVDEYVKTNGLKQRICASVMVEEKGKLADALQKLEQHREKHNDDEYFFNTFKIINDGAIESRGASMFEPYTEDNSMVYPMLQGDELYDCCLKAVEKGFDLHIHAIGDMAIYETLMAAKAVREAGYHDTRITNAHTEHVRDCDMRLFGKYNVIANTTGTWHYGNPLMEQIVGPVRMNEQFRMVSILKEGGRMSFGSDSLASEYGEEPLKAIQVAVTRKLYGDLESPVLQPESEKLSIQQCLEAYTINAAYQMHKDDKLGSLEAGKYADMVILERDIFEIPETEIYNTKIMATIKGGKATYKNA